jgi:hypothetical protein
MVALLNLAAPEALADFDHDRKASERPSET